MENEEARALVSAIGSKKKGVTPAELAVLKYLAEGDEIVDRISAPIVYKEPNELTLSPNNMRKEVNDVALEMLMASIREVGILKPIFINTRNQVVVGHRRWLAAKRLKLSSIPCIVRRYDSGFEEILHSFNENVRAITPCERDIAKAVRKLHDEYDCSFERIARMAGWGEETVHNYYEMAQRERADTAS